METNQEILARTVNAKISIEKAGVSVGAAIGNGNPKICAAYREQAIVHLTKALELLNVDHESVKVINLRFLLKSDLIRSLRGLNDADRTQLVALNDWNRHFASLDPSTPFTKRTAAGCLLAWNNALDLLKPFIGAKGVEQQKSKLDAYLSKYKKKKPKNINRMDKNKKRKVKK